jgi:Na+/H+-dicarboxylate symporter
VRCGIVGWTYILVPTVLKKTRETAPTRYIFQLIISIRREHCLGLMEVLMQFMDLLNLPIVRYYLYLLGVLPALLEVFVDKVVVDVSRRTSSANKLAPSSRSGSAF